MLELGAIKCAPDHGIEVLGEVEVFGKFSHALQAEHTRQVADHIADGGENEAIEVVEVAVECQFDHAPRHVADVGLVIGVSFHDLHPVARTHDAHRQPVHGVHDLAGEINGQIADQDAVWPLGFPLFGSGEVEVEG